MAMLDEGTLLHSGPLYPEDDTEVVRIELIDGADRIGAELRNAGAEVTGLGPSLTVGMCPFGGSRNAQTPQLVGSNFPQ